MGREGDREEEGRRVKGLLVVEGDEEDQRRRERWARLSLFPPSSCLPPTKFYQNLNSRHRQKRLHLASPSFHLSKNPSFSSILPSPFPNDQPCKNSSPSSTSPPPSFPLNVQQPFPPFLSSFPGSYTLSVRSSNHPPSKRFAQICPEDSKERGSSKADLRSLLLLTLPSFLTASPHPLPPSLFPHPPYQSI